MDAWQEEYFHLLAQNTSKEELFPHLVQQANELGFEYCVYILQMPIPLASKDFTWMTNLPQTYQTDYKKQDLFKVDCVLTDSLRLSVPFLWSNKMFKREPLFLEVVRLHLGHQLFGWSYPSHATNKVNGLFTLGRSTEPITAKELESKQQDMYWLSLIVNQSMREVLLPELIPEVDIQLTPRQREVLCWIAEGKSHEEIGNLLNISQQTVHFHTTQIMKKLGVDDETAAAVRAVTLGLLYR